MSPMSNTNRTAATVHPIQWARPEVLQGEVHAAAHAACELAAESGPVTTVTVRAAALTAASVLDGIRGAGPARWARNYRTVAQVALAAS